MLSQPCVTPFAINFLSPASQKCFVLDMKIILMDLSLFI